VRALRGAALALGVALLASPVRGDEALALVDLDGHPVALAPAAGRPLVVHFWATWCPSCRDELGDLDAAAQACGGVDVVAVDVAEPPAEVAKWLAEHPLRLRVLIDRDGAAWRTSGGRELPANAIWSGDRRSWSFGPSSAAAWRERLAGLGCKLARAERPGFLE
jgi:thiol-disulfide isomerase/thioredoxin